MSRATPVQSSAVPPVWSCDTHRRSHNQQRELKQQQLQLFTLQTELRRATNHWFQAKTDERFQLLVQTCVQILQHGLRQPTAIGTLRLVEDFEFLRLSEHPPQQQQQQQPAKATTSANSSPAPGPTGNVAFNVSEFLTHWAASCLRSRCLSRCVQMLVADKELLDSYYQREVAFLRDGACAAALFACLTAVELDQSSLLSQLEPLVGRRRHRRTSSQPNFSFSHRLHVVQEEEQHQLQVQQQEQQQKSLQQQQVLHPNPVATQLMRRFKSLPCLYHSDSSLDRVSNAESGLSPAAPAARPRCQTYNNSPNVALSGCSLSTASSSQVASPVPRRIQLINCDDIKIWTDQTSSVTPATGHSQSSPAPVPATKRGSFLGNLFGSPPVYTSWYNKSRGESDEAGSGSGLNGLTGLNGFLAINGRKLDKRQQQSLFEGVSMLDYNNCQAATSRTATEPLDIVGGVVGQQQQQQHSASCSTTSCSLSSESQYSNSNKMDNQSLAAFLQMSRNARNNTELEKENAHFRISEACIAAIEHVKWSRRGQPPECAGSSSSSSGLATEGDALLLPFMEQQTTNGHGQEESINRHSISNHDNNSAEAVGLQLISRFNDKQLPKLADLKWLVSEQDAPQQLLPLPKLTPELQQQQLETLGETSLTRGTKTWAPPRQQIIFTEHPPASRSQLLSRQHYRCAGCGMQVTRQYQQYFRYCNYLGKYLCTGCHRNQLSAIPAKILQSWDFRCYAVSSFAYRLIEQMYTFPLFHVPDLNAQLYVKQKQLAKARRRRLQLKYVHNFISTCRFATKEQALFDAVPAHITNDPDMWSMCDFVDVQNSSLCRSIEDLIELNEQHVYSCVLCTGRAFVCELCKSRELIYPWQRKVHRCGQCGACVHTNCWKLKSTGGCLRCDRLHGRQQQQKQQLQKQQE
ncbi:hypothetical protein AWZ03_011592 [Drosophila navojoa]|uniref:Rubicon Homology domain-containing protein n=1 Tax=Drosophila navojoa TaxID=7232 RepID=A0A484B2H3_DRONA|nr:run domain Beclin-1-interacting and cysteine-rich domain-containing protein [Drosophila navojoa]TDG41995.1 hypothetical protein AWZ03_011592 [Drosophila navojoa]